MSIKILKAFFCFQPMDDLDAFLKEVDSLSVTGSGKSRTHVVQSPVRSPSRKESRVNQFAFGLPGEEVERLTNRSVESAYEILMVSPESTHEQIKASYKKLSTIVHPDKCRHEKAADAFRLVKKAYDNLTNSKYKDEYSDIYERAKENVRRRASHEGSHTNDGSSEHTLPAPGSAQFSRLVIEECKRIRELQVNEQAARDKVAARNKAYLAELAAKRRKDHQDRMKEVNDFNRDIDKRTHTWRQFQSKNV